MNKNDLIAARVKSTAKIVDLLAEQVTIGIHDLLGLADQFNFQATAQEEIDKIKVAAMDKILAINSQANGQCLSGRQLIAVTNILFEAEKHIAEIRAVCHDGQEHDFVKVATGESYCQYCRVPEIEVKVDSEENK